MKLLKPLKRQKKKLQKFINIKHYIKKILKVRIVVNLMLFQQMRQMKAELQLLNRNSVSLMLAVNAILTKLLATQEAWWSTRASVGSICIVTVM